jgi:hypothetical protein
LAVVGAAGNNPNDRAVDTKWTTRHAISLAKEKESPMWTNFWDWVENIIWGT